VVKKTLTPEDQDLFRQTIGDVRTINSNKILLTAENKPKPYPKPRTLEPESPFIKATSDLETIGIQDSMSFIAPGLQTTVLKKLRKGVFGLDSDIDLHGLTSQTAKTQLLQFLNTCVISGYRCVHIVHGKGYRSADNHPVLKNDINLWLRQHKDVQAFCSAPQRAGGTGAVFVLLQLAEKYRYDDDEMTD
jgi:DNA-nicking Smr family endonuclease